MAPLGLDALIVRGTDGYLSEYVPARESTRVWLTGFTGSTGDALVTADGAWLFVDGRYHVQADNEVDPARWTVVKLQQGVTHEKAMGTRIRELAGTPGQRVRVGYETDRFSVRGSEALAKRLIDADVDFVPVSPSPVETVRGAVQPHGGTLRVMDEATAGRTVAEKHTLISTWLAERRADGLYVQKLDEIAWITNLRGDEITHQATFRAEALVTRTEILVAVHTAVIPDAVRAARPGVRFVSSTDLRAIAAGEGRRANPPRIPRIVIDPASVTVALRDLLAQDAEVLPVASPIVKHKARKTPTELSAMRSAFARADKVVAEAQRWLTARVSEGAVLTEVDFARQVEAMFLASGAVGLSFKVISASGVHGAVVHHSPSETAVIREGELMLLDTGCYYPEGYATDLTRTFFVGGAGRSPTDAQRRLYTLTLKSAIAGMSARIPVGATGAQVDGLTRGPMWAEGVDYAHGTGHGVGIDVHESPPRIASVSVTPVEEGHVFSIEPGIYQEGVGGVRIENLCTVVPDEEIPGFLRVEPLTFAPLDLRLVDDRLLTERERTWLHGYTTRAG